VRHKRWPRAMNCWCGPFPVLMCWPHTLSHAQVTSSKCLTYSLFFFFFFGDIGVWTQDLTLEPHPNPFFVVGIFRDRVLQIICPGLASNGDPSDLCPLSS
jgi:hypothetical protein